MTAKVPQTRKGNTLIFRSLKGNVYRPFSSNSPKKYSAKKNQNTNIATAKQAKKKMQPSYINRNFCLVPGKPTKLCQIKENKIDFNTLSGCKYRPLQINFKNKFNYNVANKSKTNDFQESIYVFTDRNSLVNEKTTLKPFTFKFPGTMSFGIKSVASNPGCINIITKSNQLISSEFLNEESSNSFTKFKKFKELKGYKILSVDCGVEHTIVCAKKESNYYVFARGSNYYCQLGIERSVDYQLNFEQLKISNKPRFSQVYCGGFFTFLITDTAQIWAFGQNDHGQLGLGIDDKVVSKPTICGGLLGAPIISIACGSSHSLALSSTGLLFAAGSNKEGQLGLFSMNDQKQFKIIDSMINVFIVSVAAYTNYSAAIDEFGTLYVWGGRWGSNAQTFTPNEDEKIVDVALGLDGRIAALTTRNKLILTGFYVNDNQVSQVVQIFSPLSFLKIFSGGEFFFVLTSNSKSSNYLNFEGNYSQKRNEKKILALNSDHFPAVLNKPTVGEKISLVFSSLSTINNSFMTQDFKENMASVTSGVDFNGVIKCYESLLENKNNMNILTYSFNDLLKQLLINPPALRRPTNMRFLLIGLLHPSITDFSESSEFWGNLVSMIQKVKAKSILKQWLSVLNVDVLSRILKSLNEYLSWLVNQNRNLYSEDMIKAIKAIKIVVLASARSKALTFEQFYNYEINQKIDLEAEFRLFQKKKQLSKSSPIAAKAVWCYTKSALFLLNADVKTKFIAVASKNKLIKGLFQRTQITEDDVFFKLNVTREKVLEDAYGQIFGLENPKVELKKKLKVTFQNEPAIDDGGVQREFFDVIINQILDPKVNLFDKKENGYWFNRDATDAKSLQMFKLVGIIVGLAIYNGNLVNIRFPTILYKKLKGQTVVFNDLKEFDSEVYNSLQNILTYEGDVEDLYLPFAYGDAILSDDEDKLVTNSNRKEFVECVTKYILDKSIEKQFNQFKEGFIQCAGKIVLNLFRSEELVLLVSGRDELNFYALMKATKYNDGYNEDSPTIKTFWRIVFTRLTEEEKKKLLFFVTASPRAPIGGLGALPFVIAKDGDKTHLPTSHTCFFMLVLPDEPDEEKLYRKLMIAIENSEGFAFK